MRTTSIMNSYSTVRKYEYLYSVTSRTKWRELNGRAISLEDLGKRRLSEARYLQIRRGPASDGGPAGQKAQAAVGEAGGELDTWAFDPGEGRSQCQAQRA